MNSNKLIGKGLSGQTLRATSASAECVTSARFSSDSEFITYSTWSGEVCVVRSSSKMSAQSPCARFRPFRQYQTTQISQPQSPSVTSINWNPRKLDNYELISTDSDGYVHQWSWDSGSIKHIYKHFEEKNEILCSDYSPDGSNFVTAGSDHALRIYDSVTGCIRTALKIGMTETGTKRSTHTNRIFSVRYASPHIIISGGWESAIQIWDVRSGASIRQFSGARVCSDSIDVDIHSSRVIVGCSRSERQVVCFDYLNALELPQINLKNLGKRHVNTVRMGADQRTLWCVCSNENSVIVLDSTSGELLGELDEFQHEIHSCHLEPPESTHGCLVSGACGIFYLNLTRTEL